MRELQVWHKSHHLTLEICRATRAAVEVWRMLAPFLNKLTR